MSGTETETETGTETGWQASRAATDREALLAAALEPTAEWLESIFGAGSLWRPTEDELPERLEDTDSRTFLTEVGFPSVHLSFLDYDSTDLTKDGPWSEDPDELFGNRYPDDDSPPKSYAYGMGESMGYSLMLLGDRGSVSLYDPNGWDHAAGYAGHVADSLPLLAGALGLWASFESRLFGDDHDAVLREVRELIDEIEPVEGCRFWEEIFQWLEDQ
ncbi:SUKH-4 family immunity protein [Streptomyces rimosus]|uniref:SUKH-4 family immunity protein n=1 Tax=Streptomyces rimosus TaxID=1927 RepID=UPI00067D763A|nr:SUKH-4 family immunity protein [Streptomyces rimosus]